MFYVPRRKLSVLVPISPILLIVALGATGLMTCVGDHEPVQPTAQDEKPVIYGLDDRDDVYQWILDHDETDRWARIAVNSTAALMSDGDLDGFERGHVPDPDNPIHYDLPGVLLSETPYVTGGVCSDERFADQYTDGWCSGSLIGDDLFMTAGHCIEDEYDCANTVFVFNYHMLDADNLHPTADADVFACAELLVHSYTSSLDYAIVRLDRPATPRFVPAVISRQSAAADIDTPLMVIGHPTGLPTKLEPGGWIQANTRGDYFTANNDTFGGNSGSAVWDLDAEEIIGILVRGETDYNYINSRECSVPNEVCSDPVSDDVENDCGNEESTYAFNALEELCDINSTYLPCTCGNQICEPPTAQDPEIGETTVNCPTDCGPECGDLACNGDENLNTCPEDCAVCGDGVCSWSPEHPVETVANCLYDCTYCGDDLCGGLETSANCSDCICGDAYCDAAESAGNNCCDDCGCEFGYSCESNACNLISGDGDTCSGGALEIPNPTGSLSIDGSTATATNDVEGSCGGGSANDRIYSFILTEATTVVAEVNGYDTVMYIETSCGVQSSEVACSDDGSSSSSYGSFIEEVLQPGTYFLVVDGYSSNDGDYTLDISFTTWIEPPPPAYCEEGNLIRLTPVGIQTVSGDTSAASNDFAPDCSSDGSPDVAYVFTIGAPRDITATLTSTEYDTALHMRSVCDDPAYEVACNDDIDYPDNANSTFTVENLASGTYYVIADGFSEEAGTYELVVDFGPGCENDGHCNDGVDCTDDTCDTGTGVCVNAPIDAACDDGEFCTGIETCDELLGCQYPNQSDCAVGEVCWEQEQRCVECYEDGHCGNGDFCDGVETCDLPSNLCVAGANPCPSAELPVCHEEYDTCVECLGDSDCLDTDFCNGAEWCDGLNVCQDGSNPCPSQSCDQSSGCVDCIEDVDCDDFNWCTGTETCFDGACSSAGNPCDASLICDGDNTTCVECLDAADCDDGNFCNGAEICDGSNLCQSPGNPCQAGEICDGTLHCVECLTSDNCVDDGLFCTGEEVCNGSYECESTGNPCQAGEFCDEGLFCVECRTDADCTDDGLFCTGEEVCNDSYECESTGNPCDASELCDEALQCVECLSDADCFDGFCNGPDVCDSNNVCQHSLVDPCDDGFECTTDSCVESSKSCGRSVNHGFCSDGVFCDGVEQCVVGEGCVEGEPIVCDDGVGCTDDNCSPTTDACAYAPVDSLCDNGLYCDGAETCDATLDCQAGDDPCPEQSCEEVAPYCYTGPSAMMEVGTVEVGGSDVTVDLTNSYSSPVVVATVNYDNNSIPVVTRVTNVESGSFDVRLQNPSNGGVAVETVSYIVVEEGVWTFDGVNVEAQIYESSVTDENGSWYGEQQTYGHSYSSPVVLGQVMSDHDPDWSVFWCHRGDRKNPPTSSSLYTGLHVGEDSDNTRSSETIGFIVFEGGAGTIGDVAFRAALGGDTVRGIGDAPPYSYTFSPSFDSAPTVAVVTQAAMDGKDGAWAYTYGSNPTTSTTLYLSTDEDQIGGSERRHTTEQVGYVVFETPMVY